MESAVPPVASSSVRSHASFLQHRFPRYKRRLFPRPEQSMWRKQQARHPDILPRNGVFHAAHPLIPVSSVLLSVCLAVSLSQNHIRSEPRRERAAPYGRQAAAERYSALWFGGYIPWWYCCRHIQAVLYHPYPRDTAERWGGIFPYPLPFPNGRRSAITTLKKWVDKLYDRICFFFSFA